MHEAAPWVVAGRYEVGEVVGRGGYGMVRRGLDRQTGQPVALKMLSADASNDPHVVERMLREQQAMLALAGTCAVSAVDLFRLDSGAPCLVMEWLDGVDLERQLSDWEADGQRVGLSQLLAILRPICETLQRAHEIGIVHRDIKPANIFLTPLGRVRLLDFGLSRMRTSAALTAMGMVMGSPSYIAPETWRGNSALIDHRSDLYSLAVIVFRALTGHVPFATPSLVEKLELVTLAPRPSVRAERPDLSLEADAWMKQALAIDPDQRFQSAGAFFDSLLFALEGRPEAQAGDEVSGIRARAEAVGAAPGSLAAGEAQTVLSLAWQKATALLRRFSGPRSIEPPPPTVAAEVAASTPDIPDIPTDVGDRLSSAWLDDADVEEAPDSAPLPAATGRRAPPAPPLRASTPEIIKSKQRTRKVDTAVARAAKKRKKPKSAKKKPHAAVAAHAAAPASIRVKAKKGAKNALK